ncbi:MAG: hypothetical protein JJ992_18310, partial [Planctomycetes bacterium]|nr:hypothetical protein [Planctomycetota bacterium]
MTGVIEILATDRSRSAIAVLLVLLIFRAGLAAESASGPDATRMWTDITGQYRVDARLVEQTDQSVVLVTADGRRVAVPIARLSRDDRRYLAGLTPASPSEEPEPATLRYENPRLSKVRIGLEVTAKDGACNNLVVSFPLPMAWPEQKVEVLNEEISPLAQRVTKRVLNEGVQQVEFRVPRLAAGQSARVVYTLRVERFQILPPENPAALVFAGTPAANLRRYLAESPMIEVNHAKVKAAADTIQLDESQPAWKQVETIYDWTRSQVSHHDGTKPLQGALYALETSSGDCEEITSLFVAMCRRKGIPARSVWVDHHTYPEFYLEDPAGHGLWIPCESLGARLFGGMNTYRLLLQKGDNFKMTQKRDAQRYVTPTMSDAMCTASTGGAISTRQLYTNADQHISPLHGALVLNGIHAFIDQPDLTQ